MKKTGEVPLGRVLLFVAIALGGALFDLWTKSAIFASVGEPGSPSRSIVPDILELRTSYNTGALWGFMRTVPWAATMFAVLSVVASVGIVVWLFFFRAAKDRRLTIALALIMAGAIGNCYDRLMYGRVRDFVYFHVDKIKFECAIFNFADNMLVLGALMLMFIALKPEAVATPESTPAISEEAAPVS